MMDVADRMLLASVQTSLTERPFADPVRVAGQLMPRRLARQIDCGWERFAVRFSGAPHEIRASRVIGAGETDPEAILCPAQTGATDCCGTCGLCWQSDRSIAFRRH